MFFLNLGYHRTNTEYVDGIVYPASAVEAPRYLTRQSPFLRPGAWVLFDPQLYLARLDRETCSLSASRLASYPWFGTALPEAKIREWVEEHRMAFEWPPVLPESESERKTFISTCLTFQRRLNVTAFILPVPLVEDASDEFSDQLEWIDIGLEFSNAFSPLFVSLVVLDSVLLQNRSYDVLAQTILDNLSVRDVEGVYVAIAQERQDALYLQQRVICRFLLDLSYHLGWRSGKKVIINYGDVFGLVCMSVGASSWASGDSNKARRLHFDDFADRTGGQRYPRFYSHGLIADLSVGSDMLKLRDLGLLRYIEEDRTPASAGLIDVLVQGGDVESVPEWVERVNNVAKAREHRIQRLQAATQEIARIPKEERPRYVLEWLTKAEEHAVYLEHRLDQDPLSADFRHVSVWRSVLEEFVKEHRLN